MKKKPRMTAANPVSRGTGPLTLAIAVTCLSLPPSVGYGASVQAIRTHAAYVRPIKANYPRTCKDVIAGMSGLCVLASTTPRVKTRFFLRGVKGTSSNQPVTPNAFTRLAPGEYLLNTEGDLDQLHERRIAINPGALSIVQTATLKFNSAGKRYFRLQHYQDVNGLNGRGCSATVMKRGVRAVLPGNYQVNLVNDERQSQAACLSGGTTLNAMAEEGQSMHVRKVAAQAIPAENSFRHPNKVSSLASISRFGADIQQLGLLPQWRSFNGIHNPHHTAHDALVLSGVGSQNFIIPFKYRPKKGECGISLGEAGLTAHVLLTDCTFQGRRLTGFRVNPGSYYTLNNRHGRTAIEGNYVNNPILVSGVNFKGGN